VDFEHIVLDACSTDETISILKSYPHLQWVSEPDKGQTDAINKGFRKATGDWLMWLNADDYLLPGAFLKVKSFIQSHAAVDVVFGDCDFVGEGGRVVARKREMGFDLRMLLFYGCFIPSTSTFYRRSIIDAGFLLDPTYKVLMDHEYYLRLAHAGFTFCHLPEVLACFRWHNSNISLTHTARGNEERLQIQRHYLKLHHLQYLGNKHILHFLFRAYQVRRQSGRLLRGRLRP
jgi:glycosyltransferase involved in cell wall biosynthesis